MAKYGEMCLKRASVSLCRSVFFKLTGTTVL